MRKREKYEQFLTKWDLLKHITDPYEKTKIADALISKSFKKGEIIIQEGSKSPQVCILEEGEVLATKVIKQGEKPTETVRFNKQGDVFGEISIVRSVNEPFTYQALTDVKTLVIERNSYNSTLAIVNNILNKNI